MVLRTAQYSPHRSLRKS